MTISLITRKLIHVVTDNDTNADDSDDDGDDVTPNG